MTAITFVMLFFAHLFEGNYKLKWKLKGSGCFWKFVVLVYECNVLMVWMITLGYWLAVFPADLVLPDDVYKPGLDPTIDVDL